MGFWSLLLQFLVHTQILVLWYSAQISLPHTLYWVFELYYTIYNTIFKPFTFISELIKSTFPLWNYPCGVTIVCDFDWHVKYKQTGEVQRRLEVLECIELIINLLSDNTGSSLGIPRLIIKKCVCHTWLNIFIIRALPACFIYRTG